MSNMKDVAWIIRNANLHLDNHQDLYNKKEAWRKNVERRIINATYNRTMLVPAMHKYLVPLVLSRMRESGEFNDTEFEHGKIPKNIQIAIAHSFARTIEQEARWEVKHNGGLDKPSMVKKRGFIMAAHGFHGIVGKPTKFIIGEGKYPERVNVTPIVKHSHNLHHNHGGVLSANFDLNNIHATGIKLPGPISFVKNNRQGKNGTGKTTIHSHGIKLPKINL